MNQYGAHARNYWLKNLPNQYHQIADPDGFFTRLGDEIARRIAAGTAELGGPEPEDEAYLDKVARLNLIRLRITDQILRDMLPSPETDLGLPDRDAVGRTRPGTAPGHR